MHTYSYRCDYVYLTSVCSKVWATGLNGGVIELIRTINNTRKHEKINTYYLNNSAKERARWNFGVLTRESL